MKTLEQIIHETFPDAQNRKIERELRLGDIEGWDSMSSVTFVIDLENNYNIKFGGHFLAEDQTVGDLISLLQSKGAKI